jgi:hypothetical protein
VTGPHVGDGNWARDMTDARRIIEVSARIVAFSASNPLPSGAEDRSASPLINEPVPTTTIPTTTTTTIPTTTTTTIPTTTTTTIPTTTTTRVPTVTPAPSASDSFLSAPALVTPIPASPVLDTKSGTWATWLGTNVPPFGPARALLYAFGLPIYYADAATPRVQLTVDNEPSWGTNALSQQLVPIPAGIAPQSGSDGKVVIVDQAQQKVFDLWVARQTGAQWHAAWGGVYSLSGSGSSPNPDYNTVLREGALAATPWPQPTSRATGSGMSSYAGVVRLAEIAAGVIPHALVFATDHACGPQNTGPYRYPATTTDGTYQGGDCIPQGARVQLDPSIDVDAIPGITPGERAVARALQRFGAYVNDNSPDRMSFAFEAPKPGQADPYPTAGFTNDYYNMPHIPWSQLRVLRKWQGT